MKRLVLILAILSLALPAAALEKSVLPADSTYVVSHYPAGNNGLAWRLYLRGDGRAVYQIRNQQGHAIITKNGEWLIAENDDFCTLFPQRDDVGERVIKKCGRLLPVGAGTYERYNERGELIATFTYIGAGRLLQ